MHAYNEPLEAATTTATTTTAATTTAAATTAATTTATTATTTATTTDEVEHDILNYQDQGRIICRRRRLRRIKWPRS